mmetsp:Transcript_49338/g.115879  ORF Transcript_49338/g.115879 Transcript_49338/m.115879 type:complete len:349 (+) Transcript_49338:252-1298(+)
MRDAVLESREQLRDLRRDMELLKIQNCSRVDPSIDDLVLSTAGAPEAGAAPLTWRSAKEVMIGLCFKSQCERGKRLRDFLEAKGYEVFLFVDMKGGDLFRQQIAINALYCKAFVPLMDKAWALSDECLYEFNMALRKNMTKRTPQIIPVLCDQFEDIVGSRPEVEGFLANVNCNTIILSEDDETLAFERLHESILLKTQGIPKSRQPPTPAGTELAAETEVSPQELQVQMSMAMVEALDQQRQFENALRPALAVDVRSLHSAASPQRPKTMPRPGPGVHSHGSMPSVAYHHAASAPHAHHHQADHSSFLARPWDAGPPAAPSNTPSTTAARPFHVASNVTELFRTSVK